MRSRIVFAVAFAMAAVAPVMSLPAPVQQARDVQNHFPSELGYEYYPPTSQTTKPATGYTGPLTHPEGATTPNTLHFMNLVPVTHPPPTGVMLKRSPTVDDVTMNVKRDTQTDTGTAIEQRSLKSFLNSKPMVDFNNIMSVASIVTVERP